MNQSNGRIDSGPVVYCNTRNVPFCGWMDGWLWMDGFDQSRIVSYRIVSYRIVSYGIVWYRMVSIPNNVPRTQRRCGTVQMRYKYGAFLTNDIVGCCCVALCCVALRCVVLCRAVSCCVVLCIG